MHMLAHPNIHCFSNKLLQETIYNSQWGQGWLCFTKCRSWSGLRSCFWAVVPPVLLIGNNKSQHVNTTIPIFKFFKAVQNNICLFQQPTQLCPPSLVRSCPFVGCPLPVVLQSTPYMWTSPHTHLGSSSCEVGDPTQHVTTQQIGLESGRRHVLLHPQVLTPPVSIVLEWSQLQEHHAVAP